MRASSKRPRVESSDVAPPLASSIGDAMAEEEPINHAADPDVPSPPTLDDSDIRCMLETVMTV